MTCRQALTHSLSALLLVLSGCAEIDEPAQEGSEDPVEDTSGDEDEDEDEEGEDEMTEEPIQCGQEHLQLEFEEVGPSGIGGKDIFGMAAEYTEGSVTFHTGETEPMTLELVQVGGIVNVTHADGAEEGCDAYTQIRVPVELMVLTEGGAMAELFNATLVHHSADPESIEVQVYPIQFPDLSGTIQPPEVIEPGGHSLEDVDYLELQLRMVLGESRPMATVGEEVLEDVHGVILGSGVIAQDSCGGDEDGCPGKTIQFFLGSIEVTPP